MTGHRCRQLLQNTYLSPILPVIVGTILRVANLGHQDLWYDEAFTAWLARLPWARLLEATAGDVHPPLWYVIEKVTVSLLGDSEAVLRLPAAVLSILSLWLTYKLAMAFALGSKVGTIAVWIMALSSFQVWYAQEARMYTLLLVAVQVAVWGSSRRRWWAYVLGVVLMMYAHNIGIVYWAILVAIPSCIFVMAVIADLVLSRVMEDHFDYSLFKAPLVANVVAAGLYAPWALVAARQARAVTSSFWVQRPSVGKLALTWHELLWNTVPPPWLGVAVGLLSGLVLVAVLVTIRFDRRRYTVTKLGALTFGPLLLTFIISLLVKPVLIHRLMIGCTPFAAILLAMAFIRHRRARWLAVAALPVLVFVLVGYYVDPDVQKGDLDRFVDPVRAQYRPGDAVLHTCIASHILVGYYSPDFDHYLWSQANDLSQALTDQTKAAMGLRQTTIEDLFMTHDRVWVYYSDAPITSQAERDETARIQNTYGLGWDKAWNVVIEDTPLIESGVYLVTNNRAEHR